MRAFFAYFYTRHHNGAGSDKGAIFHGHVCVNDGAGAYLHEISQHRPRVHEGIGPDHAAVADFAIGAHDCTGADQVAVAKPGML